MLIPSQAIAKRFGRGAGYVRHCLQVTKYRLGLLADLEQVDWPSVRRLVFVCKGNICRSAYSEAKCRSLGIPAVSFGLEADDHSPADKTAVRIAKARGIDLAGHRTRSVEAVDVGAGDLLLAMEPEQIKVLERRKIGLGCKLTLLGLWCDPVRPHIEDPYGLTQDYFSTCFDSIDNALHRICSLLSKLRSL